MGILNDLRARVQNAYDDLGQMVRQSIEPHGPEIMEMQRQQLFAGLASNGEDIRPYYSEDLKPSGFFHSVESAGRYAAWKQDGIRYPYKANRNPDAPNLYINGRFHSELDVDFGPDTVGILPTTPYAAGIVAKYGINTFGLTMANWMVIFVDRGAYNDLMDDLRKRLYGTN